MDPSSRIEWALAFKRSAPLLLSSLPTAIVFGALMVASKLSALDGIVMAGFIYSTVAQFLGLHFILTTTGLAVVFITTVMLSLRFLLYALTLVDEVKPLPLAYRLILAFSLTDSVFILTKRRFNEGGGQKDKITFFLACTCLFYIVYLIGATIGVLIGNAVAQHAKDWGLNFFVYATFAALLAPYLKSRRNQIVATLSLVLYLLLHNILHDLSIVISSLVAIALLEIGRHLLKITPKNKGDPP